MKVITIKQHDEKDCGATCLAMIAATYGYYAPIAEFRELTLTDISGTSAFNIIEGAAKIGLEGIALEGDIRELEQGIYSSEIGFPFVAHTVTVEGFSHFIVVHKMKNGMITISDPGKGLLKYEINKFIELWSGSIIVFNIMDSFVKKKRGNELIDIFTEILLDNKKKLIGIFLLSILITFIGIGGAYVFKILIDYAMKTNNSGDGQAEFWKVINNSIIRDALNNIYAVGHELFGELKGIDVLCISVIGLYVIGTGIHIFRGKMLAYLVNNIDMRIIFLYYSHMIDLPMKFFGTRKTGEIMARYTDAISIREGISNVAITLMLDTVMLTFGYVVLYRLSPRLTLIATIILVLYIVVILYFKNEIHDVNLKAMEEDSQVISCFKETITGIESIKAFQKEERLKGKAKKLIKRKLTSTFRGAMLSIYQGALVELISSVGTVIILWLGFYLVLERKISIGELITFSALIGYLLNPLQNLVNLQPTIQTAIVAAERLGDVLLVKKEIVDEGEHIVSLAKNIECKELSFRYGNGPLILDRFSLVIGQGQRVALVGKSGSGKTTFAKLLMKFYENESGEILIGGKEFSKYKTKDIRKKIAYVSQRTFFFADTIRNNLLVGNEHVSSEQLEKACECSMAEDFIKEFPLGLDTFVGEEGMNLSGGQRQRLAIARALLKEPDVIILDEATSNLDNINEIAIKKIIESFKGKITCIIIAHRLSTIKECDEIFVLDEGTIIEHGKHDALLAMKGCYASFWEEKL